MAFDRKLKGSTSMAGDNDKEKKGFAGLSDLASDLGAIDDSIMREVKAVSEPSALKKSPTTQNESILREIYNKYPKSNSFQLMTYFEVIYTSGKYEYKNKTFETLEEALVEAYSNKKTEPTRSRHAESDRKTTGFHPSGKTRISGKNGGDYKGKWMLIIGIISVVFMIWLIYNGGKSNIKPSYNPPSSSQTSRFQKSSSSFEAQIPSTGKNAGLQYTMPSVGTNNVFTVPEIRWCIRGSIRIEAMRDIIDTNEGIDKFNRIVDDYNSRCGSYRYREGYRARAKRDVEPYRNLIVSEAIREAKQLGKSYQPLYPSASPGISASSAPKKPSAQYTREAQQLLTDLGYSPGPVDGSYGRKTAEAVKAFQRDAGITQDGWIDSELLKFLRSLRNARANKKSP